MADPTADQSAVEKAAWWVDLWAVEKAAWMVAQRAGPWAGPWAAL